MGNASFREYENFYCSKNFRLTANKFAAEHLLLWKCKLDSFWLITINHSNRTTEKGMLVIIFTSRWSYNVYVTVL